MRLGLRARVLGVGVGLIALATVVADAWLSTALDRLITRRIRDDLRVRLALAEEIVAGAPLAAHDLDAWDALADELGGRARARISIVDANGAVVGDSEVARAALAGVENHAGRPEVAAALAGRTGAATRASRTIGRRHLYLAVPVRPRAPGAAAVAALRGAVPLAEVDAAVGAMRRVLATSAILAVALAALLGWLASRGPLRAVGALTAAARRMSEGDLGARAGVGGPDELGQLGRALDRLAASLARTLGELRGERDLLGRILDGMREGVLVLDGDGRVALVNPALRQLLGPGEDPVGRAPLEVVRHAGLQALLERARGSGRPETAELELAGPRPRHLLLHAAPLSGAAGGLVVVFVDLSEQRRLESVRRDFVANASHELRTPVTAIRSAAETLRGALAADPGAAPRFVEMIERNAERMQALVQDLLDLSQLESGAARLELEPIPVDDALEHAVELLGPQAAARRIALRAGVPSGAGEVRADWRALERILANLVDNALRYCPAGSTVRLEATTGAGTVTLEVADDGPGIDPRHTARLFERFYRVDDGRAREGGGTGLGLAIVKHLAEAMGGRAEVESEPGRGSRFRVTLLRL